MRRQKAILTTTDFVPAYGGTRLPLEMLEALAEAVKSQSIPMTLNHDARKPVHVENVDAGVRQRPDGEYEAWATFDVEEERWAEFEAERDALGAPGGMSFSYTMVFAVIDRADSPAVSVHLAADAHHFSESEILAAAKEFRGVGPVEAGRLYQFGAVPTALVVIQFLLRQGIQIPPSIAANYIYDSIHHFFRHGASKPGIDLEIIEEPGSRRVTASIPPGTDEAVAKRAISAFESIAGQPGTYECTPDGDWRVIRNRRRY